MATHNLVTQFFFKPPAPTADFSGRTIIVFGANFGLGKEASKQFVRLNAYQIVLAVRSRKKEGESCQSRDRG